MVYFGDHFVFDGTKGPWLSADYNETDPLAALAWSHSWTRSGILILTIGAAPTTWTFDQADVNFDQTDITFDQV